MNGFFFDKSYWFVLLMVIGFVGAVGAVFNDGPTSSLPGECGIDDPALFAAVPRTQRSHFQPIGWCWITASAGCLRHRCRRQPLLPPMGPLSFAASSTPRSLGWTSRSRTSCRLSPGSCYAGQFMAIPYGFMPIDLIYLEALPYPTPKWFLNET